MKIAFITCPNTGKKKRQDRIFPFASALNFGALALATISSNNGHNAAVFDPGEWEGNSTLEYCKTWIESFNPDIIGFSCISGFSYEALKMLSSYIKGNYTNIPIIVGGKDHVGKLPNVVLEECTGVDAVVTGEGELPLLQILDLCTNQINIDDWANIPQVVTRGTDVLDMSSKPISANTVIDYVPNLNFKLYYDYLNKPPCIEVARGCPYRCDFCSEGERNVIFKPVTDIIAEAKDLVDLYKIDDLTLYLQAPMFAIPDADLLEIAKRRRAMGLQFKWRAQTRVDYLTPERIKLLADAGARVLDLGLESASPEMLVAMKKTKDPGKYLKSAASILNAAHNEGIILKLNILFYAGETKKTIMDTFNFLKEHADKGWLVSAYPLLVYPGTALESTIELLLKKSGGSMVTRSPWPSRHIYPVNPSYEFSYNDLQTLGIQFGKAFQTIDMYFNERRFGYFKPGTSFEDITASIMDIDRHNLPCSLDYKNMLKARNWLNDKLLL